MLRIVIDTNIFISGTFWGDPPRHILLEAIGGRFVVISSHELLAELKQVLTYDKFARFFAKINETPTTILTRYQSFLELVEPANVPNSAVRDSKDAIVLAAAVGGKVDYLVTGDKDLLTIGTSYEGVRIVTPAEFLEILESEISE